MNYCRDRAKTRVQAKREHERLTSRTSGCFLLVSLARDYSVLSLGVRQIRYATHLEFRHKESQRTHSETRLKGAGWYMETEHVRSLSRLTHLRDAQPHLGPDSTTPFQQDHNEDERSDPD